MGKMKMKNRRGNRRRMRGRGGEEEGGTCKHSGQ